MAFFECKYRLGLTDVSRSNRMTNKAILKVLENAGGMHSDKAGYGLNDIERTKLSWVLLSWKVQVLQRAFYNSEIKIRTWARDYNKAVTYRDFEIFDVQTNKLIVKASSKWTLINIETKELEPITEEIVKPYLPEEKSVFEDRIIPKLKETKEYDSKIEYRVQRRDIDINEHVHNLYYLDFAYEVLPEDVYRQAECDNIEIMYKKQVKLSDEIVCLYKKEDRKNIIAIKSKDEKVLHTIINLY